MPELNAQLVALVLAMWNVWAPGAERLPSALPIARAIAQVISTDEQAPVYESHLEDAAMMAFFAARESALNPSSVGDGGRSHGVWQMRGACGRAGIEGQAVCWLALLHASRCAHPVATFWGRCVGPVPYGARTLPVEWLASQRETRARALLAQAIAQPE
jgi:hypothetical protein